ncbi:hypothetical protein HJFPF1_09732 [Paramyrothecium foliicola]|nr:hypothetical protein HJFPF1_09732 [Paramyrothecium foliicola]
MTSQNAYPKSATGHAALPDATMDNYRKCANCLKDGCTLKCGRCKVTGVGNFQVFYCSQECQQTHWPAHRRICRPRQQISRAVSILADVWDMFEKKTFAMDTVFVSEVNGVVHIRADLAKLDPRCWSGDFLFKGFAGDGFPAEVSNKVRLAILYEHGCGEIVNTGFDIAAMFLRPISAHIDQVDSQVKDPALVLKCQNDHVTEWGDHTVVRVTLPSREVFVMDISGAQYGWKERLYTWDTYATHRAEVEEEGGLFGGSRGWENAAYSMENPTGRAWVLRMTRIRLAEGLKANLEANIAAKSGSVKSFLSLPEQEFVAARQYLIQQAETHLNGAIADLRSRGIGRYYFDENFTLCVTETEKQAEKLRKSTPAYICRPRQQLVRAVSVIADIWDMLEHKTFTHDVALVDSEHGLVIDQPLKLDRLESLDPRAWSGPSIIKTTTPELGLPAELSEQQKRALVYKLSSDDPCKIGVNLLKLFLGPISKHIYEAPGTMKDPALKLPYRYPPNLRLQWIVKIILPAGDAFALDVTGARLGWQEKLYTWDTFRKHRADSVAHLRPIGKLRQTCSNFKSSPRPDSLWVRGMIRRTVVEGLQPILEENFQTGSPSVRAFLSLKDEDFALAKQYVVGLAEQCFDYEIAVMLSKGIGRRYFNDKFEVCITETEQRAKELMNVWFAKEEVDEIGDEATLKRLWSERLKAAKQN